MNGTWRWIVVAALAIVLIFGVAYSFKNVSNHTKLTNPDSARSSDSPIPVQVANVSVGLVEEVIAAEGVAKASAEIPLRSMVSGIVVDAFGQLGELVQTGQLLISLDETQQFSNLQLAKTQLKVAKSDLILAKERVTSVKVMQKKQLATEEKYRDALSKSNHAERDVAISKNMVVEAALKHKAARIGSPATGVISSRTVHSGMVIKTGEELMRVEVISPILVEVELSEDKIQSVFPGQKSELSFYAYPGRKFAAQVAVIKPNIDEKTRLMSIVLRLDNEDMAIKPGMRTIMHTQNRRQGLRIPSIAIISQVGQQGYVFVLNSDNIAQLRAVTLGAISEGYIEIRSGLRDDEVVVVVGQAGLGDGDQVRIGEEEHVER
ncbi:MAG: efflux RND transporter periplasmic adaptor subunit [Kordiimonadaceae bacterium]|nr:efflux RND transporter periplasmic adaptor subunit [Kordiimonadaceae bacterium]